MKRWICAFVLFSLSAISLEANPIDLASLDSALPGLTGNMETIFGVPGSTLTTIDFLSPIVVNNAGYLDITTNSQEMALLFGNPFGLLLAPHVVAAYIVDSMNYCGGFMGGLVGCSGQPGAAMMLTGSMLLGSLGPMLISHELGHNFGLAHSSEYDNLMQPVLGYANTLLDSSQIATINTSALIQAHTVTIEPVLIADGFLPAYPATPVPEPSTWMLVLAGLAGIVLVKK
jgi:hypothetical protein